MCHEIYVVGMGPGEESMMTPQAMQILEKSDVIIGYTVYLKLLGERFSNKELLSTPMKQEKERCQTGVAEALEHGRGAHRLGADIARALIPEGAGGEVFQNFCHCVVERQRDHHFVHVLSHLPNLLLFVGLSNHVPTDLNRS